MAACIRHQGRRALRGLRMGHPSPASLYLEDPLRFLKNDLKRCVKVFPPPGKTMKHTTKFVHLCDAEPVASYSWIDESVPTIVVPGSPLIWADERPKVRQVPLDPVDQGMHHDHSRMLSLFAAIDAFHNDFPYQDLDLVCDRNGLQKLLHFIEDPADVPDFNFRIDIDVVGKTCLFTLREDNLQTTEEKKYIGYSQEYLRAATRVPAGCEGMLDHKRIMTYTFGGLKILLSFTADACIEPKNKSSEDDFPATFLSLNIGDKAPKTTKPSNPFSVDLTIKLTSPRTLIPQSELIEVKTRSLLREPNWKQIYLQVYLSQAAWIYLARHNGGDFRRVKKISLTNRRIKGKMNMLESSCTKLHNLLMDILKVARAKGKDVPLSLVRQCNRLFLFKRQKKMAKPLGEYITSKFRAKAV